MRPICGRSKLLLLWGQSNSVQVGGWGGCGGGSNLAAGAEKDCEESLDFAGMQWVGAGPGLGAGH
eukprot:10535074-Lingulodinium_polyedra.AAC.1